MANRKEYKNRQDFPLVHSPITLESLSNNDDSWDNKCKCEKPIPAKGYVDGQYCKVCLGDVN